MGGWVERTSFFLWVNRWVGGWVGRTSFFLRQGQSLAWQLLHRVEEEEGGWVVGGGESVFVWERGVGGWVSKRKVEENEAV